MIDHTTILSGALIDYNDWVIRQNTKVVGAPADLKGIFYNKLVTRLKEVYDTADIRLAIKPDHLTIFFTPQGYISTLSFVKDRYAYTPTLRETILNGLEQALLEIDVTDYQNKLSYELSKVISELKKSLNYGREQTSKQ